MGVYTTYDEMRDDLREELNRCLIKAKRLMDEDTWGYENGSDEYAMKVYLAIKKARDSI